MTNKKPNWGHRIAGAMGQGLAGVVGGLGAHSFLSRFDSYKGHGITGAFGQTAFYSADSARHAVRFGAQAFGQGLGVGVAGVRAGASFAGSYNRWRRGEAKYAQSMRNAADATGGKAFMYGPYKTSGEYGFQSAYRKVQKKWGVQENGFRRFGARSAGEHLSKGAKNMLSPKFGIFSPLSLGLNIGLATAMSSDNIFDPHNGMARHLATNVGAEVGFAGGGAVGAALAAALVPGAGVAATVAAAIGFVGGGIIGSEAGGGIAGLPWKFSEFGDKYGRRSVERKSQFQDSEHAATMRQRAMQSIRRSHMSARSAFGQEALAYHA